MKLVISINEGQIVRNLFENNLLQRLFDDVQVDELVIISPAARIQEFTAKWTINDKISFFATIPHSRSSKQKRIARCRRYFATKDYKRLSNYLRKKERKFQVNVNYYAAALKNADLLLCTHIHSDVEQPIANLAYQSGIPTLGIINSWDNVYKGIETHVDKALVWNKVNYEEMQSMEGYSKKELHIGGIPAFMPYFDESKVISKAEYCKGIGFDPHRPIVTYASLGQFVPFFEETFVLEEILNFCGQLPESRRPQIIVRLHPWSKKELFSRFFGNEDIYFDGFKSYTPTLNWTPTFEEVVHSGNTLRHSDICISPGSTMVIEAAIFDTPVIVPVYNEKQPEIWEDYYSKFCLAMHFGKLVRAGYTTIVRNKKDFQNEFFSYLENRSLNEERRKQLVEDYVGTIKDPIGEIIENISRLIESDRKGVL